MSSEHSSLAVIGMDQYKGKVEFVSGWLSDRGKSIGEFDFVAERVEKGIRIQNMNTDRNSGFTTFCNETTEKSVLQALAALVSYNQTIGIDWYDIITKVSPFMEMETCTFTSGEHWIEEYLKWINSLKTKSDLQNLCMISVYGPATMLDVEEIVTMSLENTPKDTILCSLADSERDSRDIKVSLWMDA